MIKLMKYLKRSAGYIVLIIALLFLQAYCDLSLPDYTSKIINVGIQQNGIEDSVPEKIRKTSMDNLKLFMDEADVKTVDKFYEEDGDNLVLKDKVSEEDRDKLNDIFGKPMVIVSTLTSDSKETKAALAKMDIPEGTDPMEALSQMPPEALAAMKEQVSEKIDKMQDSIITQAGVSYVRAEYEAMGEDVDAIQMDYMKSTGLRMILMALITMMAAVCVVFLSSRVAASLGHDLRNSVYNKASYTVTVKVTKHVHSYKKVVIPAKTHKVKHKEKGHWVEPKWVVDKPASKVVDVPEHDAYVCSVCGAEFSSNEEAEAHVASENSKHVLASKVNKVVHHDAVAEVSHQELVTPAQGWHVCNVCGFTTPDDEEIVAHQNKYVNMQSEKMEEYVKQGMSVTDALERVDKEIPLHDSTHLEYHDAVYKTVIDTPAQEAWDETLPDVYVFTCSCGATFESEEEFNAHVAENSKASVESKHVDATYKDVPEEGHYEGERTWVVDKKAYTETVVDSPEKVIYKCSCGAIKK